MARWKSFGKKPRAILITGKGGYRRIDMERVAIKGKSGGYRIVKGKLVTY